MTVTRVNPSMVSTVVVDLATDVAAASTDLTTLVVVDEQAVAADLTIPANVFIQVLATGKISPATGKTVTIYSPDNIIASARQQIFDGAGTIASTVGGGVTHCGWFEDSSDPKTSSINDAIDFAFGSDNRGGTVVMTATDYDVDETVNWKEGINLVGESAYSYNNDTTNFLMDGTVAVAVQTSNTKGISGGHFHIDMSSGSSGDVGVKLYGAFNYDISNVRISEVGAGMTGFFLTAQTIGVYWGNFKNCYAYAATGSNTGVGWHLLGVLTERINQTVFSSCRAVGDFAKGFWMDHCGAGLIFLACTSESIYGTCVLVEDHGTDVPSAAPTWIGGEVYGDAGGSSVGFDGEIFAINPIIGTSTVTDYQNGALLIGMESADYGSGAELKINEAQTDVSTQIGQSFMAQGTTTCADAATVTLYEFNDGDAGTSFVGTLWISAWRENKAYAQYETYQIDFRADANANITNINSNSGETGTITGWSVTFAHDASDSVDLKVTQDNGASESVTVNWCIQGVRT